MSSLIISTEPMLSNQIADAFGNITQYKTYGNLKCIELPSHNVFILPHFQSKNAFSDALRDLLYTCKIKFDRVHFLVSRNFETKQRNKAYLTDMVNAKLVVPENITVRLLDSVGSSLPLRKPYKYILRRMLSSVLFSEEYPHGIRFIMLREKDASKAATEAEKEDALKIK